MIIAPIAAWAWFGHGNGVQPEEETLEPSSELLHRGIEFDLRWFGPSISAGIPPLRLSLRSSLRSG